MIRILSVFFMLASVSVNAGGLSKAAKQLIPILGTYRVKNSPCYLLPSGPCPNVAAGETRPDRIELRYEENVGEIHFIQTFFTYIPGDKDSVSDIVYPVSGSKDYYDLPYRESKRKNRITMDHGHPVLRSQSYQMEGGWLPPFNWDKEASEDLEFIFPDETNFDLKLRISGSFRSGIPDLVLVPDRAMNP